MGSGSSKGSTRTGGGGGHGKGSKANTLSVVGGNRDDLIDAVLEYVNDKRISTLSYVDASRLQATDVEWQWAICDATSRHAQQLYVQSPSQQPMADRRTWKTVRLYVASTFDDFKAERDILESQVFPQLSSWCEERKLRFADVDLRWGCKRGCDDPEDLWLCMRELDRCQEENILPFFLGLKGNQLGWIPKKSDVSPSLARFYGWTQNFSLFEMEIIHGAYRRKNPNAIFLVRDAEFVESLPEKQRDQFITKDERVSLRSTELYNKLIEQFPNDQVRTYHVKAKQDTSDGNVQLDGLSGDAVSFVALVLDFFKARIEQLYPFNHQLADHVEMLDQSQRVFMQCKSRSGIGLEKQLTEIDTYLKNGDDGKPLCIVGEKGSGKSTLMACSTKRTAEMISSNAIPVHETLGIWRLFYHSIGCDSDSSDLAILLQRLFDDLSVDVSHIEDDFDVVLQKAKDVLSSAETKPVILFIDAVDEIDGDQARLLKRWLPMKLSSTVRVVLSTTCNDISLTTLEAYQPLPNFIRLGNMEHQDKKVLASDLLASRSLVLEDDHLDSLLKKEGSSYPLWLTMACDRILDHYDPSAMDDVINGIPDTLDGIEALRLDAVVARSDRDLCIASLSLILASRRGLLENELRLLLAKHEDDKDSKRLPARRWASVFNTIAVFLQTNSEIGDGRLTFKHASFKDLFRSKYVNPPGEDEEKCMLPWHQLLAKHFTTVAELRRKSEELPYHLYHMRETSGLADCLGSWEVFNQLFTFSNCGDLVLYWQRAGGYKQASECYEAEISSMKEAAVPDLELSNRMEKIVTFLLKVGEFDAALDILKGMATLEESKLGKRPDQMADVYQLLANCKSEIVSSKNEADEVKLPMEKEVVEYCKRSLEFRKSLDADNELNKSKHGSLAMLMAKHLGSIAEQEVIGSDTIRGEAHAQVDEAMDLFKQIRDRGKEAEALMVKALIDRKVDNEAEEKCLLAALDKCKEVYGNGHPLTASIMHCLGVMHEEDKRDLSAAVNHYKAWHDILNEVFGAEHPKTAKAKQLLAMEKYSQLNQ